MQGIFQSRQDLRNATLEDLRQFLMELLQELTYRFTTISKENFGEKDLQEFAEAILSNGKARITVDDGVVTIEADEINLTGDIFINGEPVS